MILLDTNALIWLHLGHPRGRALERRAGRLHASPASLLEVQFLVEAGRIRLRPGAAVSDLVRDERWIVDEPPSTAWFERATDLSWTRDPFDRLIAAHAFLRDFRLATADATLVERLGSRRCLEL